MNQREIRVFISSTFRDMQEEREILVKEVSPALRAIAARRRFGFYEVDLRWGITEEQAAKGEVLAICLEEISRCRPYFVGLLGERYGWVPSGIPESLRREMPWIANKKEVSVTELEIVHGVLNDPYMAKRAFFYFRDPAWIESLPEEHRREMKAESREAAGRLAELKDRIRASGIPVRDGYRSPEELGELVLADLTQALDRDYPEADVPKGFEAETLDHEVRIDNLSRFFVGRGPFLDRLEAHWAGDGPALIVAGTEGSGKSALLASWIVRFRQEHPEALLIPHFVEASPRGDDLPSLMNKILDLIKRRCGIDLPLPELRKQLLNSLPGWLELASRNQPVLLVLDGVDRLAGPGSDPFLSWLPHTLPPDVCVVLSCRPGETLEELRRRGWPIMPVGPLEPVEVQTFTREFLGSYRKQLDREREQRIVEAPQCTTPLFLRVVLEELRVFGAHEELGAILDDLLAAADLPELLRRFIQRLEQDFGHDCPGLPGRALRLLNASRSGLSEAEMVELTGVPRLCWSRLRLALGELLVSRGGLLGFANDAFHEAVALLSEEADRISAHRELADYFASSTPLQRRLQEYGHQLASSAQWNRLEQALTDLRFLVELWQADPAETLRLWGTLNDFAGINLPQAYAHIIDDPQSLIPYQETLYELFRESGFAAQAAQIALRSASSGKQNSNAPRRLALLGVSYLDQNKPVEAVPILEQAAHRIAEMVGKDNPWIAVAWCNLAAARRMLGNMEESRRLYEASLAVLRREWGENNTYTQEAIHGLGVVHYFCKDYDHALELFEQSLHLQLSLRGRGDPQTAVVHDDLGNTLGFLGRYDQAEEQHRRALEIREAVYGPQHPAVADSCFNLGNILDLADKHAEALRQHRRALEIRVHRLGVEHADVRRSQEMIAGVCERWRQTLEQRLKGKGIGDSRLKDTAEAFEQIGAALAEAGYQQPATDALNRALALSRQVYGDANPKSADILAHLGELAILRREPAAGLPHLRRAVQIRTSAPDRDERELANLYELSGIAYRETGDLVTALDDFQLCLTLRTRLLGPLHPTVGQSYANIGGVHLRAGRLQQAAECTKRSLEISEAAHGANDPVTAKACGNHGAVLLRLGKQQEGLACVRRSYEIYRRALGEEDPRTRAALQALRRAEQRVGG